MGRISSPGRATVVLAGQPPTLQPNGARTAFTFQEVAEPGSVAVLRKPAVTAPAAYAGVDVAAAGPAQVALLSELNDLRTVVEAIRTVLNRSYLRDEPGAAYTSGSDLAQGQTLVQGGAFTTFSNIANATDGSDTTYASYQQNPTSGDAVFDLDLGSPKALSAFRFKGTHWDGSARSYQLRLEAKLSAADAWTTLYDDGAKVAGYNAVVTRAVANAGPWRFVRLSNVAINQGGFSQRLYVVGIVGGDTVTGVDFAAAPGASERLLIDSVRNS